MTKKIRAFVNGKLYIQEYCGGFCYFIRGESDALSLEDVFVLAEKGECLLHQFTGLLDKNGREIYEGDIISGEFFDTEYRHSETIECPVVFNNGAFNISSNNWHKPSLKIVGNIFKNPLDKQPITS